MQPDIKGQQSNEDRVVHDPRFGKSTRETRQERESIGDVVSELSTDTLHLLRREVELLRSELSDKLQQIKQGGINLSVGSTLLFVGFQALVACAILVLAEFLPPWSAALIVAAVILIVGGVMFGKGKKDVSPENLRPNESMRVARETKDTFQERVNEFKQRKS